MRRGRLWRKLQQTFSCHVGLPVMDGEEWPNTKGLVEVDHVLIMSYGNDAAVVGGLLA